MHCCRRDSTRTYQDTARAATYNQLRRFLPTLGIILEVDDTEQQAIGNWTEIVQGGGGDRQKGRAKKLMGHH